MGLKYDRDPGIESSTRSGLCAITIESMVEVAGTAHSTRGQRQGLYLSQEDYTICHYHITVAVYKTGWFVIYLTAGQLAKSHQVIIFNKM